MSLKDSLKIEYIYRFYTHYGESELEQILINLSEHYLKEIELAKSIFENVFYSLLECYQESTG